MEELGFQFDYPLCKHGRNKAPRGTQSCHKAIFDKRTASTRATRKQLVEHYVTVRNFTYYMNKTSAKEWEIQNIESWMGEQVKNLLVEEKLYNRVKKISDIQICQLIDEWLLRHKQGASYVTLNKSEKRLLAKLLRQMATPRQIQRCSNFAEDSPTFYSSNEFYSYSTCEAELQQTSGSLGKKTRFLRFVACRSNLGAE